MPSRAVYLGRFDPPTRFHRGVIELLAERFPERVVLPMKPNAVQDQPESLPIHRAILTDLNFRGCPGVQVELDDFESIGTTRPLAQVATPEDTIFVTSPALLHQARRGQSLLQRGWPDGDLFWKTAYWIVLERSRETIDPEDLPPRHERLALPDHEPSAEIRRWLVEGESVEHALEPCVAQYIRRHGLFRATPPTREAHFRPTNARFKIVHDPLNPGACELVRRLASLEHPQPELILVIGGDGTMLRAIRKHWRDRLPFYGLNVGHLGFLLNDSSRTDLLGRDLRLYQLPLLHIETLDQNEQRSTTLAFNDGWVERAAGQTAWIQVDVNDATRMPKVVCDGMLIATAAGSTSYARAMRATPLPFNAPLLTLAGSNVLKPEFWQPAVLTLDTRVTLKNLDPQKRPLRGFVDGVEIGLTLEMTARVSRIAAVELLFVEEHDPVSKLAMLQFPRLG